MKVLPLISSLCFIFYLGSLLMGQNTTNMVPEKTGLYPGDGLTGHYYAGKEKDSTDHYIIFTNLTESFTRVDTVIDFWDGSQWYAWQPIHGHYSVSWQGYIYIEKTGRYGFGTISDDGSQLWIDSILIVDNGTNQWYDWEDNISEGDTSGTPFPPLILDSGFHELTLNFYEDASYDGIEFWWLTADEDTSDIPYYGTHFHDIPPVYNANTNWKIVPKSVLYTQPDTTTFVEHFNDNSRFPQQTELFQNYPNPFNPITNIEYRISKSEFVILKIYNVYGQMVKRPIGQEMNAGVHRYQFDGTNLASGIYFYQLVAGEYRDVKKMILLR